jgi:hypothetical protein
MYSVIQHGPVDTGLAKTLRACIAVCNSAERGGEMPGKRLDAMAPSYAFMAAYMCTLINPS